MNVAPPWPKALLRFAEFVSRNYFRAEVRGLENIPEGPCLFVGNHNLGAFASPEVWIFAAHYFAQPNRRPIRGLAHGFAMKIPIVARVLRRLGAVPATFDNGLSELARGRNVLVFPGGAWEAYRPSRDRDRIDFKGRTGFARLALEAGVPIVPIVTAGAHDGWWVLARGSRLARFTGLERFLRIDVCPVALGLPYGLIVGPFMPVLPLPRKVIMSILPALIPGEDHDLLAKNVTLAMQEELKTCVQLLRRKSTKPSKSAASATNAAKPVSVGAGESKD